MDKGRRCVSALPDTFHLSVCPDPQVWPISSDQLQEHVILQRKFTLVFHSLCRDIFFPHSWPVFQIFWSSLEILFLECRPSVKLVSQRTSQMTLKESQQILGRGNRGHGRTLTFGVFLDSLPVQTGSLLQKIGAARETSDLVKHKERKMRAPPRKQCHFPLRYQQSLAKKTLL